MPCGRAGLRKMLRAPGNNEEIGNYIIVKHEAKNVAAIGCCRTRERVRNRIESRGKLFM